MNLISASRDYLSSYYSPRSGESKMGDRIVSTGLDTLDQMPNSFIILGIPEDIGVRANLGIGGTHTLWEAFLRNFLNLQSNSFLDARNIAILGHIEIGPQDSSEQNPYQLREEVSKLDGFVYPILERIFRSGHVPIVVGGGHNNAYPIIKGLSLAEGEAVRILNMDLHHDYRAMEGRHSGNGFRYASHEQYLETYLIWGLSKYYAQQEFLDQWSQREDIFVVFYESMISNTIQTNTDLLQQYLNTIKDKKFGLEVDMDSIENMLSSAMTPSGFTHTEIRQYVRTAAHYRPYYLHVCEGAEQRSDGLSQPGAGKMASYLVADFVSEYLDSFTQW